MEAGGSGVKIPPWTTPGETEAGGQGGWRQRGTGGVRAAVLQVRAAPGSQDLPPRLQQELLPGSLDCSCLVWHREACGRERTLELGGQAVDGAGPWPPQQSLVRGRAPSSAQ